MIGETWLTKLLDRWREIFHGHSAYVTIDESEELRKNQPIFWFLSVAIPDSIETAFTWPFRKWNDIVWWLRYRYSPKYRYYLIDTKLKPGYYDADHRMLHGLFSLLVDFVECEKGWMQRIMGENEKKVGFIERWRFRDRDAGIRYLTWEATLDNPALPPLDQVPSQAEAAREILELYKWWTENYPNRLDPSDASGWSDECEKQRANGSLLNQPLTTSGKFALDKYREIEERYYAEEQEMLKRLIDLRHRLWT